MNGGMANVPVRLSGVGKAYRIYAKPQDRLKQMLWGRFGQGYGEEFWALRDVDLVVRRGESVGVVGRNGAGKSTLLQLVTGTLSPTAGEVRVEGRIAAMIELGAGFNPEFTGRENVRLSASVLGLSPSEIEERLVSILDFADIGEFAEQPVKIYSSGMYARLAFAVAAHVDADILIVDEILSVGDAAFGQRCMRFIRGFQERGGTLLFVSHDIGAMLHLCQTVVWLDRGGIRVTGPAKQVCHDYLAALSAEGDRPVRFRQGGRRRPQLVPATEAPRVPAAESGAEHRFDWLGEPSSEPAAKIVSVELTAELGEAKGVWHGGEHARLRVTALALNPARGIAVMFEVRDRLGQILFSADTAAAAEPRLEVRESPEFCAEFEFVLPKLAPGDFVVAAAVAHEAGSGFVLDDRRLDAQFFHVAASSSHGLVGGLVGTNVRQLGIDVLEPELAVAASSHG
jgi:lipopolysaccharide transport system ATP-binding protein